MEASSVTHPDMAPDGGPRLLAIQANMIQDDSDKGGTSQPTTSVTEIRSSVKITHVGRTTQYCSTPHFISCRKNRPS